MPSKLLEKQWTFVKNIGKLIRFADENQHILTFGEAWRSEDEQKRLRIAGLSGVRRSLHQDRLAVDFNLFERGTWIWLKKTSDHKDLASYWKSLNKENVWGGDFGDGNHYSMSHEGRN